MYSFILLYISSLLILFPKRNEIKENNFYALIFSSFSFAHALLGFISLILIALGISKFPILTISLFIFCLSFLKVESNLNKIFRIKNYLYKEIKEFLKIRRSSNFQKICLYISFTLLILILISSIGPINHPDAADYHVGYPYQYYLKGGFFIDGGLHQGLLGIGDYANLAFIQEKSNWCIRFLQIINLPLLMVFLSKKFKSNIFLVAFLSIPTFIQWSTIGKPLFLGESCLIVVYLIWKENKTPFNLKLLSISILNCICFKLSSLIIIFPLVVNLIFYYSNGNNTNEKIYKIIRDIVLSRIFLLTSFILISLLFSRFFITGNFAYPLFTKIFNADNRLVNEFANMLKNYNRENFFFFKIFIPTNISDLGQSLGPGILIIFISIFYKNFQNIQFMKNTIFNIATSQLILLLLFCQGRPDYYCAPLILLFFQIDKIEKFIFTTHIKYFFYISLFFQIFIINIFISVSIFSNFMTTLNYSKYMNEFAYGFNISRLIDNSMDGKVLFNDRNMRLYYPSNYLDIDKMRKCIDDNINLGKSKSRALCLERYDVKQIINAWEENIFNENNAYECEIINSFKASRNLINKRKNTSRFCKKKELSK